MKKNKFVVKKVFLLVFVVGLISVLATSVFAALPAYMGVEGPEGDLECSVESEGKEGTIEVIAFNHEVYIPYDIESGQVQGSRRLGLFTIVKEFDKCSPYLYEFFCEGTLIPSVDLRWYRINQSQEEHYFTHELENVKIISIKSWMPNTRDPDNNPFGHMEEVSFVYQRITWIWEPDSIEYSEENY